MMKRSVLAVLAVSFFAVAACQPAEEPAAEEEMGAEEAPEMQETPEMEQPPAAPMDTGMMGDTMGGQMMDDTASEM